MRPRPRLLAAAALLWLVAAAPVAADCDMAGPIEEELPRAPIAFVGTVVALENSAATFEVSEVWAGDVPDVVSVHGLIGPGAAEPEQLGRPPDAPAAPAGAFPVSEDDRTWRVGARYLVLPYVDGGFLHDNICTATTEWRADLEQLRPSDARLVSAREGVQAAPPLAVIVLAGVAVLLVAAGIVAFRRR